MKLFQKKEVGHLHPAPSCTGRKKTVAIKMGTQQPQRNPAARLPPTTIDSSWPAHTTRFFSVFVSFFFFYEFEQIRIDIQYLCMNGFKFQEKQVFRI